MYNSPRTATVKVLTHLLGSAFCFLLRVGFPPPAMRSSTLPIRRCETVAHETNRSGERAPCPLLSTCREKSANSISTGVHSLIWRQLVGKGSFGSRPSLDEGSRSSFNPSCYHGCMASEPPGPLFLETRAAFVSPACVRPGSHWMPDLGVGPHDLPSYNPGGWSAASPEIRTISLQRESEKNSTVCIMVTIHTYRMYVCVSYHVGYLSFSTVGVFGFQS